MKLIDKDALVAEIEKLIANGKLKCQQSQENNDQVSYIAWSEHIATCGKILSLINTLEVKEVDLEKELDSMITPELKLHKALPSLFDVAKHFFELGLLNTITEEDCKLIWNIGDEIPYMPEEEFFKELLKRYKAQKEEEV